MLHTDTRETTECGEHEAAAATTTAPAVPAAPAAGHELFFQRCLWCGIPAYRRSFCRACQVTGTAPVVVGIGARVRVVRTAAPVGQGLPVVELTHPATSSERWW
jgi:hypothetical protein